MNSLNNEAQNLLGREKIKINYAFFASNKFSCQI